MGVLVEIIIAAITVAVIAVGITIFDVVYHHVHKKHVAEMNRQAANYSDVNTWIVFIAVQHRLVGLYYEGHAVSHARIKLGKEIVKQYDGNIIQLTIGDFRKIDVEIPRFSYRVLYEYKVPHETPVIIY